MTNLIELALQENNLTGEIPDEIENLENLEYLDLSQNELNGKIPDEVWELENLEYVFLNDNQFNGSISSDISIGEYWEFLGTRKKVPFMTDSSFTVNSP